MATAPDGIHLQNFFYENYVARNVLPSRGVDGRSDKLILPAHKSMRDGINGLASTMIYDDERLNHMSQYRTTTALPHYNLATTMGYESMPLHTWTREQLEEQLMILRKKELANIQGQQQWLAAQLAGRRSHVDLDAMEVMPTPSMLSRMTSIEESGAPPKRHANDDFKPFHQRKRVHMYNQRDVQHTMPQNAPFTMIAAATNKFVNFESPSNPSLLQSEKSMDEAPHVDAMLETSQVEAPLCRMETRSISTDEGSQMSVGASDVDSEFEFNETSTAQPRSRMVLRQISNLPRCDTTIGSSHSDFVYDWKDAKPAKDDADDKTSFAHSLSGSLKQDYINFTKNGILTNDLRQEYIRRSKLYPKVRGVWFNSTVRRMGWVGQAYKKCKRIEKIFSISKHGFDGARELAIAFRNSQKPVDSSTVVEESMLPTETIVPTETTYSVETNDDFPVTETGESAGNEMVDELFVPACEDVDEDIIGQEEAAAPPSCGSDEGGNLLYQYKSYEEVPTLEAADGISSDDISLENPFTNLMNQYTSELSHEQKAHRDFLCKEALRFMLCELSVLMELDVPVPRMSQDACRRGVQYHLDLLESCQSADDMAPYMAIFGQYICKGLTPVDMPFGEVFSILRAFSHCKPLDREFCSPSTQPFVDEPQEVNLIDLIVV